MAAPENNKNAEKWTLDSATELFNACLNTASDRENKDNDFIGEVAQENGTYTTQLHDLKEKYPQLERIYNRIKSACEANCFRNGKKGDIVSSLAIMNLKSNHGWTDRSQQDINLKGSVLNYTEEERLERIKELTSK